MKKEDYRKLGIVGLFVIAMAYLETLIVVYLRKIYYPEGFGFPLNPNIESFVYSIELVREFFTIVMLLCIAVIAAKKFYERFAYFLYAFAVWDIFYYIWLKLLLNWPESLFTWDLLFLIPFPWLGPVIAPIVNSITMILFTFVILQLKDKKNLKIIRKEWIFLILGGLIILYTYLYDYGKLIIGGGFLSDFPNLLTNHEFLEIVGSYPPSFYNWFLFLVGELIILGAIYLFYNRYKKSS